ncbi:MAG TPA: MFS transporter [Azospirillaceae bacterium]|nr:MFS transporter [Azospirillaceae bacterium]
MSRTSARLSLFFSLVGHSLMHILAGLYVTVVLGVETDWRMTYEDLIRLWTLGSLLIGVGAPLAGWLGDRWSESRMMAIFFLLTGGGSIAAGLADGPDSLMWGLAALGLGASIYHPVGMAWTIRNAEHRGKALGVQGIFGTIGVASAALVAGSLSELISWRAALIVPGVVTVALGIALVVCIALGLIVDPTEDLRPEPKPARGDVIRTFVVLSVTMLCGGMVFNAVNTAIPKWFGEQIGDVAGGTLGIGGLVTLVYLVAGLPQILGGHLADRYPLKRVYVLCLMAQLPIQVLAAAVTGMPVVALATTMIVIMNLQIPAENLLLSRYTPAKYRGLAFGAKFILSFGAGPLAVQMVAAFHERWGGFVEMFVALAAFMALAVAAGWLLPGEGREKIVPVPAGAA